MTVLIGLTHCRNPDVWRQLDLHLVAALLDPLHDADEAAARHHLVTAAECGQTRLELLLRSLLRPDEQKIEHPEDQHDGKELAVLRQRATEILGVGGVL